MAFDLATINSIGKIATTILVLLAVFLFTVESRIKTANRLFTVFLLLVAFDMSGLFIYEWLMQHPFIDVFRRSGAYLQMPLIYYYVKLICFKGIQITANALKHVIIVGLFWAVYLFNLMWLSSAEQISFVQDPNTNLNITFSIVGELQYFFYTLLIFKALATYRTNYQANFANYDSTAYNWLFQFTCISVGAHLFALTKDFMVHFAQPSTILLAYLIVSLTVLLVICWLVLKALHHPSITRGIKTESSLPKVVREEPAIKSQTNNKSEKNSCSPQSVNDPQIKIQIDSLEAYMNQHEPFLEPDLNIESLAKLLQYNPKELSTLINHHMGTNFFNYVNAFRIQKAKDMLGDTSNLKRTVLQILYEVGFNSKSSFNTAFKKHTGLTPTVYRKSATS